MSYVKWRFFCLGFNVLTAYAMIIPQPNKVGGVILDSPCLYVDDVVSRAKLQFVLKFKFHVPFHYAIVWKPISFGV